MINDRPVQSQYTVHGVQAAVRGLVAGCALNFNAAFIDCFCLSDLLGQTNCLEMVAQRTNHTVLVVPLRFKQSGPVAIHPERCLLIGDATTEPFDQFDGFGIGEERRAALRARREQRHPAGIIIFTLGGTDMGPIAFVHPITPLGPASWANAPPYCIRDKNAMWEKLKADMQQRCDRTT